MSIASRNSNNIEGAHVGHSKAEDFRVPTREETVFVRLSDGDHGGEDVLEWKVSSIGRK